MENASPLFSSLGRLVRQRRKALGLTQVQLSLLAGCGVVLVYDVEQGKSSLRLDKLLDVLAVLGLELVVDEGQQKLRIAASLLAAVSPAK